ncbi:hypothetical protein ACFE04_010725 [Oxalis oulophora]
MSYETKQLTATIALPLTVFAAAISSIYYYWKTKSKVADLNSKIETLEASLNSSLKNCAAERRGRIRAQQDLRKGLAEAKCHNLEQTAYPFCAIGVVQSCFSTRNGTPRQPLLVPLARACLNFDPSRVPPASLEGLEEYSHCWIIYVFHLNTDLDKLWKEPSRSKLKAKVRVPRLKGGKMGVFATRTPHRPCPIGLTVAKVEAVRGHMVLLSGVDLVDGTPVLDIKPYLPFCDSVKDATVPTWLTADNPLVVASVSFSEDFSSSLADCWKIAEKKSLYASADEMQSLIEQVLSWDIRSVSQRTRPHNSKKEENMSNEVDNISDNDDYQDEEASEHENETPVEVIYRVNLEGLDVSYRIDSNGNVIAERVTLSSEIPNSKNRCNHSVWRERV